MVRASFMQPTINKYGELFAALIAQHRAANPQQENLWQQYPLYAMNFVTTRLCQFCYIHAEELAATEESALPYVFAPVVQAEINYLSARVQQGMAINGR